MWEKLSVKILRDIASKYKALHSLGNISKQTKSVLLETLKKVMEFRGNTLFTKAEHGNKKVVEVEDTKPPKEEVGTSVKMLYDEYLQFKKDNNKTKMNETKKKLDKLVKPMLVQELEKQRFSASAKTTSGKTIIAPINFVLENSFDAEKQNNPNLYYLKAYISNGNNPRQELLKGELEKLSPYEGLLTLLNRYYRYRTPPTTAGIKNAKELEKLYPQMRVSMYSLGTGITRYGMSVQGVVQFDDTIDKKLPTPTDKIVVIGKDGKMLENFRVIFESSFQNPSFRTLLFNTLKYDDGGSLLGKREQNVLKKQIDKANTMEIINLLKQTKRRPIIGEKRELILKYSVNMSKKALNEAEKNKLVLNKYDIVGVGFN